MDGNTEPVIAVIGHPIAGNPSQFALERALASAGLEWRVFSFDVSPQSAATALDGLEALGVSGVLIDESLTESASTWRDQSSQGESYVDCLCFADASQSFTKMSVERTWAKTRFNEHAALLQRDIEKTFVAGEIPAKAVWRTSLLEGTIKKLPRSHERITDADLIVIEQGDDGPVPLDVQHWPKGDESVLVVDFSDGHPDLGQIESMGYQVVSSQSRRLAILSECFRRWTSVDAPRDVVLDAIEEYLAV